MILITAVSICGWPDIVTAIGEPPAAASRWSAVLSRKGRQLWLNTVNFLTCDGPKGNAASPDFSYISVKCTPEKLHIKAIDDKGRKFDEFEIDQQGKLKTLYLDKELKDYLLPEK